MLKLGAQTPSVATEAPGRPETDEEITASGAVIMTSGDQTNGAEQCRTFYDLVSAEMLQPADRTSGAFGRLHQVSAGVLAVFAAFGVLSASSAQPVEAHEGPDAVHYVVEDGETLSEIAEDLNVDLGDLAEMNGISELDTVVSGTALAVPPRRYNGPVKTHTVGADETLSQIAEQYDVSMSLLQKLNNIDNPDHVTSGSTIEIPDLGAYFEALEADGSATGSAAADADFTEEASDSDSETEEASADQGKLSDDGRYRIREVEYVVVAGDTLSQIAEDQGVMFDELVAYNNITDTSIVQVDATLIIPIKEAVQAVDRYAASFEKWAQANDLDPNLMKAIGWQESHWNPDAVSSAGAVGMTQIMPATADYISGKLIGTSLDRKNADENIRMGARYMAYLLELSDGNLDVAIASYYQGYTSVSRNGMRGDTQAYVSGVRGYIEQFESGALPDRDLVNSRSE